MKRTNSTEFDAETPELVVIFMRELMHYIIADSKHLNFTNHVSRMQGSRTYMASAMRLGCRRTLFQTSNCISSKLCGQYF